MLTVMFTVDSSHKFGLNKIEPTLVDKGNSESESRTIVEPGAILTYYMKYYVETVMAAL